MTETVKSAAEGRLPELVARLRAAVDAEADEAVCARVKSALTQTIRPGRALLPDWALVPAKEGYARHLLYRDPAGRFSMIVMVWGPGQGTPIHDHGGLWCVECVYRGRIRVRSYEPGPADGDGAVRFEETDAVVAGCGEAGHLIPPFDYHVIDNPSAEAAATLHVYGGDMMRCRVFEPVGDGRYRAQDKTLSFD